MGRYKVEIYPAAQQDLNDIVDYINSLSPDTAIKYYDRIVEKIGSLTEMPERHPLLKDPQLRLRGYRTLIVENYMVFYIIKGDTVQIRRIIYGRRQYEWML